MNQERHDHPDLGHDEGRLQHRVRAVAQGVQPVPDELRGERRVRVGEYPGIDLRAPVQQQRHDDQEDHAQDQPRRPGMRAVEPRGAAFPVRVVPQPDHREHDDPGQHPDGHQVLEEPDERPVPDPREGERPVEQIPVRLDDRQQQDRETPERQEVRRPRHGPLQQLALPQHLGRLHPEVGAGVRAHRGDPVRRRLPAERQPLEPPPPAPGDREREHGEQQSDGHPHNHANLLSIRSSSVASRVAAA